MSTSQLQPLTKNVPDTILSIYNRRFDGYVHIHPDGYVELTSPAGTVTARFKELEKADWLRESYIRMLIEDGVQGEALEKALTAIGQVDRRLLMEDPSENLSHLTARSEQTFRRWSAEHGIAYEELSEEDVMQIVEKGLQVIRGANDAAGNR